MTLECKRCQGPLSLITSNRRTAVWCPLCLKELEAIKQVLDDLRGTMETYGKATEDAPLAD